MCKNNLPTEPVSDQTRQVHFKIKRQDSPDSASYWEEFLVPYRPKMNVISALMEIQRNPVKKDGKTTKPIVWESNCLEEVCGACSMVINQKARQACSTLVDQLEQPIVLEPLSKFRLVRDLMVDRAQLFEHLKRVKAWIDIDGTTPLGPGPRMAPKTQEIAYHLSRCMSCGCCMEACPNVNDKSKYIGPAAIAQVERFILHPSGKLHEDKRLEVLLGEGGIAECGNNQNCAIACPKGLPLTTSIARLNRKVNSYAIKRLFDY